MAGYLRSSNNGAFAGRLGFYAINGLTPNTTVGIPPYEPDLGNAFPLIGELLLCENMWSEDCFEFSIEEGQSDFDQLLIHSTIVGGTSNIFRDISLDDVRLTCELVVLKGILSSNDGNGSFIFSPDFEVNDFTDNLTYAWDFGDGSTSREPNNVNHVYTIGGEHTVCLTISDEEGCCQTECITINVVGCNIGKINLGQYDLNHDGITLLSDVPNGDLITGLKFYLPPFHELNINISSYMIDCEFYCGEGAVINVTSNLFVADQCDYFACDHMWQGLKLKSNSFTSLNLCNIYDAEYGLELFNNCSIFSSATTFQRNHIGVFSRNQAGIKNIPNNFSYNNFLSQGQMLPSYQGQVTSPGAKTLAGMDCSAVGQLNLFGFFGGQGGFNTFDGISNGILLSRTNMVADRNSFKNLAGQASTSGTGIRSVGSTLLNIANSEFKDCKSGILFRQMISGKVNIGDNDFENVENNAIFGLSLSNVALKINNQNNFTNCRFGVQVAGLSGISGLASLNIDDNIFTNNQNISNGRGIQVSGCNGLRNMVINNNTMTLFHDGISVLNSAEVVVSRNNITLHGSTPLIGINLGNADFAKVNTNTVTFDANNSNDQYGILQTNSEQTEFCCNIMNLGKTGLQAEGMNMKTRLINSTFNDNDAGLTLHEGSIGDQPLTPENTSENLHGNQWFGTSTLALIETANPMDAQLLALGSKIWNNPILEQEQYTFPEFSNSIALHDAWFPHWPKVSKFCNVDPDCSEHVNSKLPPTIDDGFPIDTTVIDTTHFDPLDWDSLCLYGWKYYVDVANGNVLGGTWAGENQWLAQSWLYQLLKHSNPDYWRHCHFLDSFYVANISIYDPYVEVDGAFNGLYALNSLENSQYEDLMEDLIGASDDIVDFTQNNAITASNVGQLYTLNDGLNRVLEEIVALDDIIEAQANTSLEQIEMNIQALSTINSFQTTLKQVWGLKVKYFQYGESSLTNAEWSLIRNLANECHLIYGEAVYEAASLLSTIDEPANISAKYVCNPLQPRINKEDSSFDEVEIYPNPSNGLFYLMLPITGNELYTIEISDALGRIISKSNSMTEKVLTIDLSNQSNGIFFSTIYNRGKVLSVHKLIKIN